MKKSFAVVLVMLAAPGTVLGQLGTDTTWIGKTTVNTGKLAIGVQTFRNGIPMVSLQNRSDKPARCSATFSNVPQFSETRSATIPPGKRATLGYGVRYNTARVDIDVKCAERMAG